MIEARRLIRAIQDLSLAYDLNAVMSTVRLAARELTGADGATFVLQHGDEVHYADEDAISPLWKGQRFPMNCCISGWAIQNRSVAVIEDIYQDARIPHDVYRPTFVKSLVIVPIRSFAPIGAIGNYWARLHRASEEEIEVLQALADSRPVAIQNVELFQQLNQAKAKAEGRVAALERQIARRSHAETSLT